MTYLTVACVQEDLFQVASYSPQRIPEGSRRDITEALVRDFDDGELRFRVAQITDGGSPGNGGQKNSWGNESPAELMHTGNQSAARQFDCIAK